MTPARAAATIYLWLGKVLNPDVSVLALHDFTKFGILPLLSSDLKTMLQFSSLQGQRMQFIFILNHYYYFFLSFLFCSFFFWCIYFDFSLSIPFYLFGSLIFLSSFIARFFVFLSLKILAGYFSRKGINLISKE